MIVSLIACDSGSPMLIDDGLPARNGEIGSVIAHHPILSRRCPQIALSIV